MSVSDPADPQLDNQVIHFNQKPQISGKKEIKLDFQSSNKIYNNVN